MAFLEEPEKLQLREVDRPAQRACRSSARARSGSWFFWTPISSFLIQRSLPAAGTLAFRQDRAGREDSAWRKVRPSGGDLTLL